MKENGYQCPEARRRQLEDYLHNELCAADAADIREHMAHCPECRDEHKVGVVLTQVIARACKESAPESLRVQILSDLRSIQAEHDSVTSISQVTRVTRVTGASLADDNAES